MRPPRRPRLIGPSANGAKPGNDLDQAGGLRRNYTAQAGGLDERLDEDSRLALFRHGQSDARHLVPMAAEESCQGRLRPSHDRSPVARPDDTESPAEGRAEDRPSASGIRRRDRHEAHTRAGVEDRDRHDVGGEASPVGVQRAIGACARRTSGPPISRRRARWPAEGRTWADGRLRRSLTHDGERPVPEGAGEVGTPPRRSVTADAAFEPREVDARDANCVSAPRRPGPQRQRHGAVAEPNVLRRVRDHDPAPSDDGRGRSGSERGAHESRERGERDELHLHHLAQYDADGPSCHRFGLRRRAVRRRRPRVTHVLGVTFQLLSIAAMSTKYRTWKQSRPDVPGGTEVHDTIVLPWSVIPRARRFEPV
jgi:hypothetical protein